MDSLDYILARYFTSPPGQKKKKVKKVLMTSGSKKSTSLISKKKKKKEKSIPSLEKSISGQETNQRIIFISHISLVHGQFL